MIVPGGSTPLVFEHFNSVDIQTRWVTLHGRRYFFASAGAPPTAMPQAGGVYLRPPDTDHSLAVISDRGVAPQTIVLKRVVVDGYLNALVYDIAPIKDGLLLVYASIEGLFQMVGRPSGESLTFTPPQRIHTDGRMVHSVQLRSSGDFVHLAWLTRCGSTDSTLTYMRRPSASATQPVWDAPQVISATAADATCLVADGKMIHICWTDHRFRTGVWTSVNGTKLFLCRSANGGASFEEPLLLSARSDERDIPAQALLVPGNTAMLLLWRNSPSLSVLADWNVGLLDYDKRLLSTAGDVSEKALTDAFANRMTRLMRDASADARQAAVDVD
jgi:hypothetical protein